MLKPIFRKNVLSVVISAVVVSACSSGGGGTPAGSDNHSNPPTTPGDTTTQSSTYDGRITGFGSVIVNGVHFEVDGANIMHDGVPITEQDLKVGMIVRLAGSVDEDGANGTATEIEFDEEVKGTVSSINLESNSFIVLGQTVLIDSATVFDKITFDALAVGNLVEISGYFDADGALRASLVELDKLAADADEKFEVKGVVRLHDAANKQFMLHDLVVDYGSAELSDFPDGVISDGMRVEVKAGAGAAGEALVAAEVEYEENESEDGRTEGSERVLEGVVTAIGSATEFTVNGQVVLLTDTTEFEVGSVANIYINTRIKVEGEYNADGQLVAKEVELQRRGDAKLEAVVDSVNVEAGTLTVFGADVRVTQTTVWEDESAEDDQFINLAALMSGDRVEMRGYHDADGVFVATAVERKDADDEEEFELEGPVANIVLNSSFTVLGVTVSFDANTEFELGDEVTLETFFAGLVEGDQVEVEGMLVSSTELSASSVELISEDEGDEFGGDTSRGMPDSTEGGEGDNEEMGDEGDTEAGETDGADGSVESVESGSETEADSSPEADEQDAVAVSV